MTATIPQENETANKSSRPGSSAGIPMPPTDYKPHPYDGPTREQVIAMRKQYANPAITTLYKEPLMIVEGHMQWLFDETGKRYLDMFAGIVTVSCGHCHPRITRAIHDQVDRLQHTTTIYLHPGMPSFAKKLASKMPEELDVTYFVNSGSEANDLAIQIARAFTGNHDVIALRNAYHGASPFSNTLTSHSNWKYPVNVSSGIHHAINPDPYRSPFEGSPEEIASKCAADIKDLIRFSTPGKVAAFIAEPIQGVGGATHGARNYLREAYSIIREHGGLCIADEVQTGFGRTGDHYWGFQNFDVVPDIVVMAKGIGNGVPLAAVTTRREVAQALTQRTHFNTFGGNPVCMAAGSAVLDVIDEDGLQENSRVVGARLKSALEKLEGEHKLIGDVRGMGLMLGVELVKDRATKEPAKAETLQILEEAREMGVLIGKGGIDGSVIRIKPPMCITADDADFTVDVLHRALVSVEH
jgi:alanine-glyoxylate transaminase / (R)-3-amino-2-methylpropionate-pyruvate transaminase